MPFQITTFTMFWRTYCRSPTFICFDANACILRNYSMTHKWTVGKQACNCMWKGVLDWWKFFYCGLAQQQRTIRATPMLVRKFLLSIRRTYIKKSWKIAVLYVSTAHGEWAVATLNIIARTLPEVSCGSDVGCCVLKRISVKPQPTLQLEFHEIINRRVAILTHLLCDTG